MKKRLFLAMLLFIAIADMACAGQFRVAPPKNMRKRQPPHGYRESRLEIVNEDDRGYAIDVDYRRNRLEFRHRDRGDIYVPGNSRITLVFDDDDNWRIEGDHEWLEIEIRSGRTTTMRLETRMNRHQVGLFATVEADRRKYSKQLFRYSDRPGRPKESHRPAPPPPPAPKPQPPAYHQPRPPAPPPSRPHAGKRDTTVGDVVGGIVDHVVGNDRPDRPGRPGHGR